MTENANEVINLMCLLSKVVIDDATQIRRTRVRERELRLRRDLVVHVCFVELRDFTWRYPSGEVLPC